MGKNRKKPPRRKGQMNRWTRRSLNTGPTKQSHADKAIHRVQLADINGYNRQLVDNPFLDALFPSAGGEGKNEPRLDALRRRAEEIALAAGGRPDMFVKAYEDKLKVIRIYFNEQHTRYFFVKEELRLNLTQKSITYSSLAQARQMLTNGDVAWFPPEMISS